MKTAKLWIFLASLSCGTAFGVLPAQAQAPGALTYLDDEAEAGGFDVTASLQKLPVELVLAEQAGGDGYHLKLAAGSVELAAQVKRQWQSLAKVNVPVSTGAIIVQRRGPRWRVINGSRVVLEAEDDRWHTGQIGFRGGLKDGRVQPIEDIVFDDDFMRVASDVALASAKNDPRRGIKIADVKTPETLWRIVAGTWSTTGLSENTEAQVAQSANPFAFKTNAPGENLALGGRPFWSDYTVEASVKPQGARAIGLAVYAHDAKNYLLFHWAAGGAMQLRGVVDGKMRVLDEAPGGFEQKQWYRLRFSIAGGQLRAFVDDSEVLRARTGLFGRGQVGLYSEIPAAENDVFFDDVTVRSIKDFHDDFAAVVPGRWQTIGGAWDIAGKAVPSGVPAATAIMGEGVWSNYVAAAQITLPSDAAAGLVLHHQKGKGAYLLRIAGSKAKVPYAGQAQIVEVGAKSVVLARTPLGSQLDGKSALWNFSAERGYLKATIDGKRVVDAFDESLPAGRAGIFGQRGAQGAPQLRTFSVEFPRPHSTWAKVPDLYEQELQAQTMGGWSTPEGFWVAETPIAAGTNGSATPVANTTPANKANKVFWHKGAFWGDGSIRFNLPKLAAEQKLALILDNGSGPKAAGGLLLTLRVEAGVLQALLSRRGVARSNDQEAAATLAKGQLKLSGPATAQAVEVEQHGSFIVVRCGPAAQPDQARTLLVIRTGS